MSDHVVGVKEKEGGWNGDKSFKCSPRLEYLQHPCARVVRVHTDLALYVQLFTILFVRFLSICLIF